MYKLTFSSGYSDLIFEMEIKEDGVSFPMSRILLAAEDSVSDVESLEGSLKNGHLFIVIKLKNGVDYASFSLLVNELGNGEGVSISTWNEENKTSCDKVRIALCEGRTLEDCIE